MDCWLLEECFQHEGANGLTGEYHGVRSSEQFYFGEPVDTKGSEHFYFGEPVDTKGAKCETIAGKDSCKTSLQGSKTHVYLEKHFRSAGALALKPFGFQEYLSA